MKEYVELLEHFQKWNPVLVEKMKQCDHHFDEENLNPYHMESDVWTHTMLMYNDFMKNANGLIKEYLDHYGRVFEMQARKINILLGIAILCHDIGKVFNRSVPNWQYGKIAMFNHPFTSVQFTIDFIDYLINRNIILEDNDIHCVLNAVSNHMDYLNLTNIQDRVLLANEDSKMFVIGSLLNIFDKRNSIDLHGVFYEYNVPSPVELEKRLRENIAQRSVDEYDLVIFAGCPGSGKDYIAQNLGYEICSFDDIRVQTYLNDMIDEFPEILSYSEHEIYKQAYEYCKENQTDLVAPLHKKINNIVESNMATPAVCNTSLSRKSRRSLANTFRNLKIKVIFVAAPSHLLTYRNENRESKVLGKMVMNKFMYNQQIPSLYEFKNSKNVIGIEVIFNG